MFAARNMTFSNSGFADADVNAWIAAVETADAQSLEKGVKNAMNQMVLDLKSNSLWATHLTLTVRMGARTLAGALIDVVNPTTSWGNFNFVSGDYNRTTGLIGNGTTKYLQTPVANSNLHPPPFLEQNNRCGYEVIYTKATGASDYYFGKRLTSGTGVFCIRESTTTSITANCCAGSSVSPASSHEAGLIGMSRSASGTYTVRGNATTFNYTTASTTPTGTSLGIVFYATDDNTPITGFSNHRGQIGGLGSNMNLETLETIMDAYIVSINALGL